VTRFIGKAAEYGWQTAKGMTNDPATAFALVVALLSGNPLLWLKATMMAIAATSLAMAAGIKNPIILSLIAAAAGAAVAGLSTDREFFKSALGWGVARGLHGFSAVQRDETLSLLSSNASSMVVNEIVDAIPQGSSSQANEGDFAVLEARMLEEGKQDEAAKRALTIANGKSVARNREFGGLICRDSNGEYTSSGPQEFGLAGAEPLKVPCPPGTTMTAIYHTHGEYSLLNGTPVMNPAADQFGSDDFFLPDMISAGLLGRLYGPGFRSYLGTPSGYFLAFDPNPGRKYRLVYP
jgi:Domain of unknown function (DUF4329)